MLQAERKKERKKEKRATKDGCAQDGLCMGAYTL